jgi:hypothetical protein
MGGGHVTGSARAALRRQPRQREGLRRPAAAAGWHIDFNWGDANAFESDWRRNDDTRVDNADFVFTRATRI